jgi:hypothetical protein
MTSTSALTKNLEEMLLKEYGPILSDDLLRNCLGYRSLAAFRKSVSRNTVPITVFTIANRSGKFALTTDVARWLAQQKDQAIKGNNSKEINIDSGF